MDELTTLKTLCEDLARRVESLEKDHAARLADLNTRLDTLAGQIDACERTTDTLSERVDERLVHGSESRERLEERLSRQIQRLEDDLSSVRRTAEDARREAEHVAASTRRW